MVLAWQLAVSRSLETLTVAPNRSCVTAPAPLSAAALMQAPAVHVPPVHVAELRQTEPSFVPPSQQLKPLTPHAGTGAQKVANFSISFCSCLSVFGSAGSSTHAVTLPVPFFTHLLSLLPATWPIRRARLFIWST